jgi:hypothetical protein
MFLYRDRKVLRIKTLHVIFDGLPVFSFGALIKACSTKEPVPQPVSSQS